MKNSTLLVGLALMAGSALSAAAQEPETIRGIKISTDAQKYYYRISNMRVQRLNYSTGVVAGYDPETAEVLWDEPYMTDNAVKQVPLPLFLPDGYPSDWDSESMLEDYSPEDYKLTPQPYEFPYMGLVIVEGNFWTAFSAQKEVMDPNTTYWYFTKGSGSSNVRIHNAVIDGTIRRNSSTCHSADNTNRSVVGFDTKENNYYVIGLKDLLDTEFGEGEMAFSEKEYETAFALSTSSEVTNASNNCLDANNYIIYNWVTPRLDENGEPLLDEETGEAVNLRYGFTSVDRCWSPLRSNGSNDNHLYNNGSIFFVDDADAGEAERAIEAYKQVVIDTYREGAVRGAQDAYRNAATQMEGWINVPALWKDQTALRALITECENWTGNADEVVDLASQEAYIAKAGVAAQQKVAQAAALVGKGAVVTLCNTLPLRNVEDAEDEDTVEEYQLGNAYLSAGLPGTYNSGGVMEEAEYMGVGAKLAADANCEWELIPVEGTINFLLYNPATQTYIRKYEGLLELAGGEDVVGEGANNFSWATTSEKSEAAPFHLTGCPDPESQRALSDTDQMLVEDYAVNTDITNNVYLQSTLVTTTVDETTGETNTTTAETSIHRSNAVYGYTFVNWNPENGRWYADSNTFTVGVVVEGAINEIEAADNAKNLGIYDLQGRKVAKASKGLYIINGKKTIVK